MGRKKEPKEGQADLIADFFGDEADEWLLDDESESLEIGISDDPKTGEVLKVAPLATVDEPTDADGVPPDEPETPIVPKTLVPPLAAPPAPPAVDQPAAEEAVPEAAAGEEPAAEDLHTSGEPGAADGLQPSSDPVVPLVAAAAEEAESEASSAEGATAEQGEVPAVPNDGTASEVRFDGPVHVPPPVDTGRPPEPAETVVVNWEVTEEVSGFEVISEKDLPTLEVDPTSEELRRRFEVGEPTADGKAPPPPIPDLSDDDVEWPDDDIMEVTGDDLEAIGEVPAPLVRTLEPAPIRVGGKIEAPARLTFSAPPLPKGDQVAPEPVSWQPAGDAEEWRQIATTLVAEAALARSRHRGDLLFWAGRVYRRRLGDHHGASVLLGDAVSAGADGARLHREIANSAMDREDWTTAESAFLRRAEIVEGAARSEALQDAAGMAAQRGEWRTAIAHLQKAVEADSTDFIALSLLRDQLAGMDLVEERLPILSKMAELSPPAVAAESYWEQGSLLQSLGRTEKAREAFEKALDQSPGHAASYLALEAIFASTADAAGRGNLFEREANRAGQPSPGWWFLKAARAYVEADHPGRTNGMFTTAVAMGDPMARREQQVWLARNGKHKKLVQSIEEEIGREKRARAKAFHWFRIAQIREGHLHDEAGALEAYRKVLEFDGTAEPATQAVARLMRTSGQAEDLVTELERRLEGASDEASLLQVLFRLAELAEDAGDDPRARAYLERLLDETRPDYLPALEALHRVLVRMGDFSALVEMFARRAEAAGDSGEKALWFHLAATAGPPAAVPEAARGYLAEAHALAPAHPAILETYAHHLHNAGEWSALAQVLRDSAESMPDPHVQACLFYRAARVHVDHLEETGLASVVLQRALELDPEHIPARALLQELAAVGGSPLEQRDSFREQAASARDKDRKTWWLLAAAAAVSGHDEADDREDLLAILEEDPGHSGALVALEIRCLLDNDRAALADVYRRAAEVDSSVRRKANTLAWLVDLHQANGDVAGARQAIASLLEIDAPGIPWQAIARLAMAQHHWEGAAKLLETDGSPLAMLERARVIVHRLKDLPAAAEAFSELIDIDEVRLAAAHGLMQVAGALEDMASLRLAHLTLATHGSPDAFRAAHFAWSADLCEEDGDNDGALEMHRQALSLRLGSRTTFDAVRRLLVSRKEPEALIEQYATYRPDDHRGLAEDLDTVGAWEQAVGAWKKDVEVSELKLPSLFELSQAQVQLEDWSGLFATLCDCAEQMRDASGKAWIEGKKRWVLAEKLAESDEAWELYSRLHKKSPDDRTITEALARIAGQRGETKMAIEFLQELANHSQVAPEDAARYHRRIGEAHEAAGDTTAAQQSFLDALDCVTHDRGALDGLKRLATAAADWPGLIAVLQRELGLVKGLPRLVLLKEIATVTEEHFDEPAVAIDAWRKVLEVAREDVEALRHLLSLSRAQEEWAQYVEAGALLAHLVEDDERIEIFRDLGDVSLEHLSRDEAIVFYEEGAAASPPDLASVRHLCDIYLEQRDWKSAVRLREMRAEIEEDIGARVAALAEAAKIEDEMLHDREAASTRYQVVLDLDPDHHDALVFLATHLHAADDHAAALDVFERLEPHATEGQDLDDFDVKIEVATFFYQFAGLLQTANRHEDALVRFERALDLNPTHLATLQAVGPLYTSRGRWKDAERIYRQLLQLTGGQGDKESVAHTYTELGMVERALGSGTKAYKRFTKALDLRPNHIRALKGMAMVYEDRGDWDNCMKSYNNVIYHATNRADVIDAYLNKGRVLDQEMNRQDKAAEHYQRALDVDPAQPLALVRLAELSLRSDDWAKARHYAERGLAVDKVTGALRATLLVCRAAAIQGKAISGALSLAEGEGEGGEISMVPTDEAEAAVFEARGLAPDLLEGLGEAPLEDLDKLLEQIRKKLPR